jgi:hypothetical protein
VSHTFSVYSITDPCKVFARFFDEERRRSSGGFMFQVNKSPMAMCVRAATAVPFVAHRAHRSNGCIFYVDRDGSDVFVSCMNVRCCQSMLLDREKHCHMAR